jgi:hypothetical protein
MPRFIAIQNKQSSIDLNLFAYTSSSKRYLPNEFQAFGLHPNWQNQFLKGTNRLFNAQKNIKM